MAGGAAAGEAPVVGTGMERVAARDSGAIVSCKRDGIVDWRNNDIDDGPSLAAMALVFTTDAAMTSTDPLAVGTAMAQDEMSNRHQRIVAPIVAGAVAFNLTNTPRFDVSSLSLDISTAGSISTLWKVLPSW